MDNERGSASAELTVSLMGNEATTGQQQQPLQQQDKLPQLQQQLYDTAKEGGGGEDRYVSYDDGGNGGGAETIENNSMSRKERQIKLIQDLESILAESETMPNPALGFFGKIGLIAQSLQLTVQCVTNLAIIFAIRDGMSPASLTEYNKTHTWSLGTVTVVCFILLSILIIYSVVFVASFLVSFRTFNLLLARARILNFETGGAVYNYLMVLIAGVANLWVLYVAWEISHSISVVTVLLAALFNTAMGFMAFTPASFYEKTVSLVKFCTLHNEPDEQTETLLQPTSIAAAAQSLTKMTILTARTAVHVLVARIGKNKMIGLTVISFLAVAAGILFVVFQEESRQQHLWQSYVDPCTTMCVNNAPDPSNENDRTQLCQRCLEGCITQMGLASTLSDCPKYFIVPDITSNPSTKPLCTTVDCPRH